MDPMNIQPTQPQAPTAFNKNPMSLKLIAIIVAVIVIVGGIAWWFYGSQKGSGETSQEIAPGQTLVTAAAGKVVQKFPAELILENSPEVLKSYRIEYSAGNTSQPFVRYVSGKSFAENVALFTKYFQDNQWEMLRLGDVAESPATFFEGAKNGNEANVILKEDAGRVEVSIAYTLNS